MNETRSKDKRFMSPIVYLYVNYSVTTKSTKCSINTMLCPFKVNSNTLEVIMHTSLVRLRLTLCNCPTSQQPTVYVGTLTTISPSHLHACAQAH